jgi:hypothetical protein
VRIPIACTLTSGAAEDRIEEWRQFLARSTDATERVSVQQIRLRLNGSRQALTEAVDLAQREKACCGFFDFVIEVEADSSWLSVQVPPEATGVLADFAALLPR